MQALTHLEILESRMRDNFVIKAADCKIGEVSTPNAHNSSFAIGWQTVEHSAVNQYSASVVNWTFNNQL
jgi:hypothetical protein